MSPVKLTIAAVVALVYVFLAAAFVREDRKTHTGGFISLQGMMSAIVTLPMWFPFEYMGHKLDYRSNWQMGLAIALCGALIFGLILCGFVFVTYVSGSQPVTR